MTDRELLELAAKAAGIEIVGPIEKYIVQPNKEHIGGFIVRNNQGGDSAWNPLTDDGDALRLAVKLGLGISIPLANKRTDVVSFSSSLVRAVEAHGDPYAATRRAIVRAAAEIGKGMK